MSTVKLSEAKISSSKPRDSVNAYLKEIGRIPLLDAEEEIIYAKQVQRMMSCLEAQEKLEQETNIIDD